MLTQEQRNRLEPFTKHERYGQLLIDAIKIWEIAKPVNCIFGLDHYSDNWELLSNSCCLVGASLVNKKHELDFIIDSVAEVFSLTKEETWSLSNGFDQNLCSNDEAYIFGEQVAEIVFDLKE
jgi:hypothetical protein